ncbi:MAG: fumarylacetoacetate hydrolase family protein, partial [Pseudomonadota bacterium]
MKFVTFFHDGREGVGILREDQGIVDLTQGFGSLHKILRDGQLNQAMTAAKNTNAQLSLDRVSLLPPITSAEKYFCIGVNYANRNAEYKDGSSAPTNPSVFMRSRESFVGHGQDILRPPESHQLDYEGEIAVIIGKEGRRIKRERAR